MTGCEPTEPGRPSMTGCVPDEPRLRGRKKKKVTWGENETRIIPARPEESQSRPSMTGCDVPSVQDNQVLAVEKPLRRRNVKKPKAPAQQPKVTLRDELAAKLKSRNVAPKASGIQRLLRAEKAASTKADETEEKSAPQESTPVQSALQNLLSQTDGMSKE